VRLFNYFPYRPDPVDKKLEKKIFRYSLLFPTLFVIAFWLTELIETVFELDFTTLGVFPLHWKGLPGILLSPFIHSDFKHLGANTVSFFILSSALFYFYRKLAYRIFLLLFFLSGLCVWLGGREAWHIGASGLVYGLASFLFFSGIFRNDVRLLTIGLIVAFLYGSMFWGIFPIDPEISWESHFWGAVSGLVLSAFYRKQGPQRQKMEWEDEPEDGPEGNTGFPGKKNVSDKTETENIQHPNKPD
jgi:membrane associated rhomboid family serine protease